MATYALVLWLLGTAPHHDLASELADRWSARAMPRRAAIEGAVRDALTEASRTACRAALDPIPSTKLIVTAIAALGARPIQQAEERCRPKKTLSHPDKSQR